MEIETIYRLSIAYDFADTRDDDGLDRIELKLSELSKNCSVDCVESNLGGPCWGPYFVAESESLKDLEKFKRQALGYLRKWKGLDVQ